jgi:uncharacterized membrane protein YgcG
MVKNRLIRATAALTLLIVAFFSNPLAASADVDDFEFESMHADYSLSLGEHNIPQLKVTETLVAVFPETDQNRGIRRLIPDGYQEHSLGTEVVSVVDENGLARDFSVESVDGFSEVVSKFTDDRYVHGRQTYIITYTQKWVIRDFEDTSEFYWDVNGTGWGQPFGRVSATVTMSPVLSQLLQTDGISCYAGPQGSKQVCDEQSWSQAPSSSTVGFSSDNLAPGETLTINLPFSKGLINTGDVSLVTGSPQYLLFWFLFVVILAVLVWGLWYRIVVLGGRRMRKFVTVQYAGPLAPELGVVGSIIGGNRWQAALVVQAAVLGYLTIAVDKDEHWTLARTDKVVQNEELKRLLDGLFAEGRKSLAMGRIIDEAESIRISTVFNNFSIQAAKQALDQGYYSHFAVKTAIRGWLVILAATIGLIWVAGSLDEVVDAGFTGLSILFALVASAVHFAVLVSKRLPTRAGIDLKVHLEGLEDYIRLAEKDRLAFLQSPKGALRKRGVLGQDEILHLYEDVLPWAVLLGLEEEWSKVLTTFANETSQPTWIPIATVGGFNLSGLNTAISQSMAVSSDSGSGGGGSSGGGGGGGGGGGV